MIANRELGYVYAAIHKTGSASTRAWLKTHHGGQIVGAYHALDVPAEHRQSLRFVTVRDPFERVFSWWCYHRAFPMLDLEGRATRVPAEREDFLTFIGRVKAARYGQAEIARRFDASIFVRLECLRDDLARLPFVGSDFAEPPHLRPTPGKPAGGFFGAFARDGIEAETVREAFAEDFTMLGYEAG